MATQIPTTKQLTDANLTEIESKINQTTPIQDVAFNRVIAALQALLQTSLYKYAIERSGQTLAITADGEDLETIGAEYDVIRGFAIPTVLRVSVNAADGTVIPATVTFRGVLNGIDYNPDTSATAAGGAAILTVTAVTAGTIGNLNIDDTLTLDTVIPGAESIGTVTEILELGTDEEPENIYKQRVLNVIRARPGGGNAVDYKIWAEEVEGVATAFVYAGKPFDVIGTSFPGDRTVYVQALESIDPDGIAPPSLLDAVRDTLNFDPVTFESRPPLGLIDDTLFIESIVRNEYFVEIRGGVFPPETEGQAKSDILAAVENYFEEVRPFVDGVDYPPDRNDVITALSISDIVQEILAANRASAQEILFGPAVDIFVPKKTLDPNERVKLGGIAYVG
jgi:hypothetical protein